MSQREAEKYMNMALRLAARGRGKTSPNPMVGAVLVKDDVVVGKGFHAKRGEAHAEINALSLLKGSAKGSELYINLEPCCHTNRTPPCTKALVKAGIKKVVVGMKDPNPLVSGGGIEELQKAGIEVVVGVLEKQCRKLNEFFIKYITKERPFVIVKIAESLDGKIATYTGNSRWITNEKSRRYVHKLRHDVDAVLVGIETVLKDDPLLTVRNIKGSISQPTRIILDSRLRIPFQSNLLMSEKVSDIIVATTEGVNQAKIEALEKKNVAVIITEKKDGRVDIAALLFELAKREISSILVEGGAEVNASFIESCQVDKMIVFISGCIIGGKNAPSPIGGSGCDSINNAMRLSQVSFKRFDDNIMVEGYVL